MQQQLCGQMSHACAQVGPSLWQGPQLAPRKNSFAGNRADLDINQAVLHACPSVLPMSSSWRPYSVDVCIVVGHIIDGMMPIHDCIGLV